MCVRDETGALMGDVEVGEVSVSITIVKRVAAEKVPERRVAKGVPIVQVSYAEYKEYALLGI